MSETGAIKFACDHVAMELAPFAAFDALNACRRKLLHLRMLGVDENGIGFGNISARGGETGQFYISASGTGGVPELSLREYARVTAYDFAKNWLRCEGVNVASSESLTHAAVYESDAQIGAVIHGHSAQIWQAGEGLPTTSAAVEYGTAAMAEQVRRLFRETDVAKRRMFLMGGHQDGFVAFGATAFDAFDVLLGQLRVARGTN